MAEKVKKPFYKKWWVWLIAIIIIGGVAVGGEDSSSNEAKKVEKTESSNEAKADSEEKESEGKEEVEDKVFKVGDTVELNEVQITLNSAEVVSASEYTPAEKGSVLAVNFEAINNSDDSVYVGAEEFVISTEDGTQHGEYYGKDDGFMNENISSGKKITGTIYYDVPEESKYEIVYEPTFTFNSETITFEVSPQS